MLNKFERKVWSMIKTLESKVESLEERNEELKLQLEKQQVLIEEFKPDTANNESEHYHQQEEFINPLENDWTQEDIPEEFLNILPRRALDARSDVNGSILFGRIEVTPDIVSKLDVCELSPSHAVLRDLLYHYESSDFSGFDLSQTEIEYDEESCSNFDFMYQQPAFYCYALIVTFDNCDYSNISKIVLALKCTTIETVTALQ